MATSSFKSSTKRTSLGSDDPSSTSSSSSSNAQRTTSKAHRRARSLSRVPETPKGKFVNTKRGSEFPDLSLDELALEFGRSVGRFASETASSKRRGRSVSRHTDANHEAASSRRRSISVLRHQLSDSESDADLSQRFRHQGKVKNLNNKSQVTASMTEAAPNGRQLRRSLSQKDLSRHHYGYSRNSSALTDDDTMGSHMSKFGTEKTIRAVYSQKKIENPTEEDSTGLYEAMRKELRHAVEEIRIEHQQAMGREKANLQLDKADFDQVLSIIKQKCGTMFKQFEKSKQDLPAKIELEEQQARDLSKIIKEMVYSSKSSATSEKPGWTKKRSNDKNRLSKQLGEEAEKYFEDFASNVEDTDISSFDGERSDASSTRGGTINEIDGTLRVEALSYQSPAGSISHPTGTDGVILPWLQWDSSNDSSLSGKSIRQPLRTKALEWNVDPDMVTSMHDPNSNSKSSIGSSSPGLFDAYPEITKTDSSRSNFEKSGGCKRSQFDMEEYRHIQMNEELLFERYKERQRINSGGLLLCAGTL